MRTALFRIILAVLAAAAGVALLFYGDHAVKQYFNQNLESRSQLQSLQTTLYALEGEVLRNGSYLYYSYDRINHLLSKAEKSLQALEHNPHLQTPFHRTTHSELRKLKRKFRIYARDIQRYLTVNASLKNSAIYIPTLQLRAFKIFDTRNRQDREVLLLLSRINAAIFLARNAQDIDFLSHIKERAKELERLTPETEGARRRLLTTLQSHLEQFITSFPVYIHYFNTLLKNDLLKETESITLTFQKEGAQELEVLNKTTWILLILYLLSLIIVIYFIVRTYRENQHLRNLKNELERTLVSDPLTGLGNRLAYRRKKHFLKHPTLILVNIDRFKHINDFYGSTIGDAVLKETARELSHITPHTLHASLYRMGGDDFAILFEREDGPDDLTELLAEYQRKLHDFSIDLDGLAIDVTFALGASEKSDWLFETADMALKAAKRSQRKRYMLYTSQLDNRAEISRNIQALRNIREAISQGSLIPYFQPIYHRESGRIDKFEALARIERNGGKEILHPYSFIHAAKEAKLSGEITLEILRKTLKMLQNYPYEFSVNIGAEDIANREDRERIIHLLEQHRDLCGRLIFEILESEEIRDYEATGTFISTVKRMGCRIAIDDFGSGYSNFEKILLLDIDMLKVDGNIIRRIDHDRHAELIVRTILDFARHAGWETIAEFVHSKAVYDKVMELKFDYIQGYYVGEPSSDLQKYRTGEGSSFSG